MSTTNGIFVDPFTGNVGIGTTPSQGKLNINGPLISSGIYAQFSKVAGQSFTGSGGTTWETFQLDTIVYNNGISLNTSLYQISFTYPGAYFITIGFRWGGGSDVWTGVRLYGDGSEKGKSFGTGNVVNDPGPAFFQMIAFITNTGATYELQLWRNVASLSVATPNATAGHAFVSTFIRIG